MTRKEIVKAALVAYRGNLIADEMKHFKSGSTEKMKECVKVANEINQMLRELDK